MNKNAAIIEGDTTKKFNPVSKVKVSNSDTGESTWVPEESKETHSLSVIKNGIYYAASEGYTAYDTVTVNVSSETEVNYEGILADMPDLADLGLYDLDDLEGLEGLDLDLEELQDLENLILDGDLEEGEIPTSGSTIKGIDPDTGETLEVGLDEDGNLMEQALPDHIKIVVLPAKRKYMIGDILDFSYIHVYLMKLGTERFTCEQYPTGEIPFGELIFPQTVVEGGGHASGLRPHSAGAFVCHITDNYAYDRTFTTKYNGNSKYGTYNPGDQWIEPIIVSDTRDGAVLHCEDIKNTSMTTDLYPSTITIDGVTFYYFRGYGLRIGQTGTYSGTVEEALRTMLGTVYPEGGTTIPVQWMRSDGEILEDTYEIEIVAEEEPVPEPEPDPYADSYDFIWEGKAYCFNKSLARSEIMYSNGTIWQTWLGGQSPPYTVDQALKLKLIVQVGWSGGGSTSGGF